MCLAPANRPQREEKRSEAEGGVHGHQREPHADAEGDERATGHGSTEQVEEERLLRADPGGTDGEQGGESCGDLDEQGVVHRRRDPEGMQEQENGDESAGPVGYLPEGDTAQVGLPVPEYQEALSEPAPEVADLLGEPQDDDEQDHEHEADRLQERSGVATHPAEVERRPEHVGSR